VTIASARRMRRANSTVFGISCCVQPLYFDTPTRSKGSSGSEIALPHVCMRSPVPQSPNVAAAPSASEQSDSPSLQQLCERQLIRLINLHNVLPLLQVCPDRRLHTIEARSLPQCSPVDASQSNMTIYIDASVDPRTYRNMIGAIVSPWDRPSDRCLRPAAVTSTALVVSALARNRLIAARHSSVDY